MLHLPAERLAALTDETPTRVESEHLALCAECRRERDAYRCLRDAASDEAARLGPPLTDWATLANALRAEGVLAPAGAADPSDTGTVLPFAPRLGGAAGAARRGAGRVTTWFASATWARAAAALMLVAGGAIGGRLSAGQPALPVGGIAAAARDTVAIVIADSLPTFRSATEALAHLTTAEQHYQYAAAFLGQLDSSAAPLEDSTKVYEARLAALENVVAATRQALYQAPHDPVINRYYLATLGARQAAVEQLHTAAGERVNQY